MLPRSSCGLGAFVAGALLAAMWATAEPARACSELCGGGVRVSHEPSIPGNLIAFDVLDPELPFSLETVEGESVPASVLQRGGKLTFEADEPVAPGTPLRLRYTDCDQPQTYDFVAGPHAELVTRTPSLDVAERHLEAAGTDAAVSIVRLRYRGPDAENVAPHLVQAIASVDGRSRPLTRSDDGSIIELRSACDGSELEYGPVCALLSTPPGVHHVEVTTHIVGAELDPDPLVLEVDTTCPGDALGSDADVGPDDSAGCAFGRAPHGIGALPMLAALGALVVTTARRRYR